MWKSFVEHKPPLDTDLLILKMCMMRYTRHRLRYDSALADKHTFNDGSYWMLATPQDTEDFVEPYKEPEPCDCPCRCCETCGEW
jgi:hypothetical protein